MASEVIFHRLMQRDMNEVRQYYIQKVGESLADRFYEAFLSVVDRAAANPKHFHDFHPPLRRAGIPRFPYHFLYRETLKVWIPMIWEKDAGSADKPTGDPASIPSNSLLTK